MAIDVKEFWQHIGSAWEWFQDKPTIESYWTGLASGIEHVNNKVFDVQLSKSLLYMPPAINTGPNEFRIIWSGLSTELTVTPLVSGGLFEFGIDEWTYSVPQLRYEYKYNGITHSGMYVEDIDYRVTDYHKIIWIGNEPEKDLRIPSNKTFIGYAPYVYKINPILMNTWARFIGFNIKDLDYYASYGQDKYKHLKMLIWALMYYRINAPSIKILRNSYAIARGLPFSYTTGTLTSENVGGHDLVHIGNDTYVLPSGVLSVADGPINQFDIICDGVGLDDYTSDPVLISNYGNQFSQRNTLVYKFDPSLDNITYSMSFLDSYIDNIMPSQITHYLAHSIVANVKIFLEGPFSNGAMDTSLNSNGYIPTVQPYSSAPWNYNGDEFVAANFFASHQTIVDWILLELRSGNPAISPQTIKARRAAFLKSDGTIVDTDGSSQVRFYGLIPGSYYITVFHRNHLAVESHSQINLGENSSSLFDFTTNINMYYGSEAANLGDGKYGMFAGDINNDKIINATDRTLWRLHNGDPPGYLSADTNLNTEVTITDSVLITKNANVTSKVP